MNLQIQVPDVDRLHAQALRAGAAIDIPLEKRWYRRGDEEAGNRQFVVIDLGSGLIDQSQRARAAAIQIAEK